MKKRNVVNLVAHIGVGGALAALVLWNRWFLLLATFIYAWLREKGQHRYVLSRDGVHGLDLAFLKLHRLYRVEKSTFFGWMTWHSIWEVFQWEIGCAVALTLYEIFFA